MIIFTYQSKLMKTILNLTILLLWHQSVYCQTFNNEWIDYSKTYYKFTVGGFGTDQEGVPIRRGPVRIYQQAFVDAGLQSIIGSEVQLWKDGREVPVFVSNNGLFLPTDFIEFWGEIATGFTDRELYPDSSFQLSDAWNLYSDSAAYFLTMHSGSNLRILNAANDLGRATMPADNNFLFDTARYFHDEVNEGFGVFLEQKLYQSTFSQNEGWTSRPVTRTTSMPQYFPQLFADTSASGAACYFSVAGNGPGTREVRLTLNGDTLIKMTIEGFSAKKIAIPIQRTQLFLPTASFRIENLSDDYDDEIKVGTLQIFYPRLFNFGGHSRFEFRLNPSAEGRFIQIENFNFRNAGAILHDLNNLKRYFADTSVYGYLRFYLPPSEKGYQLALFKDSSSVIKSISTVKAKSFINFSSPGNQGDYLIISNRRLMNGSDNAVAKYGQYRSSDSGGGYNVTILDVEELIDQFAFGVQMHPIGIKNFLRFARKKFAISPQYVFLIGKGVSYSAYRPYGNSEYSKSVNLVPVFGSPGSDNMLSSEGSDAIPATPIGRLSAVFEDEIISYLEKVKEFESVQKSAFNSLEEKGWMKKVLQLVGVNDLSIGATIDSMTANYRKIISDTAFGGQVITFSKYADSANYPKAVLQFGDEMNKGCGILEYFGHSSSSNIDFNLDNPSNYNNQGKYPFMIVNGCKAGNIFDYDAGRLTVRSSLSEKFVLEPDRGAIGYLSSSNFGIVEYLDIFTKNFYSAIASSQYGKGIGNITKQGIAEGLNFLGNEDFYGTMHAEQFTFHGDPAISIGGFALPDYFADSTSFELLPSIVPLSTDSFFVKVKLHNIGRATSDSVHVIISRKFPEGNSIGVFDEKIKPLMSIDSIELKLPVVKNRDRGRTEITVEIDPESKLTETTKSNNKASKIFDMQFPALMPVYPYNYSVVNKDTITFTGSTLFAIDSMRNYAFELDTTPFFNSSLKQSRSISSAGGTVSFQNVRLPLNNTAYYWRLGLEEPNSVWSIFSFNYRDTATGGFEQSDFFQFTGSTFQSVSADSVNRNFGFAPSVNNLFIQHSIYPTSGLEDADFSIFLNGSMISASACVGSSIIFNIFDPLTFKPVLNTSRPYNAGAECRPLAKYNFEYSTQSASTRKNAMDFLDNFVQNGYYVIARKIYDRGNSDWAPTVWARDTSLYGKNNSLYHRLKDQGTQIDSFNYPRTFIFFFKKNDSASFNPVSILSKGIYDRISYSKNMLVSDTVGNIKSPVFGPATRWKDGFWKATKISQSSGASFSVYAKRNDYSDSLIYSSDTLATRADLSTLDARKFPFIYFKMDTKDPISCNPVQPEKWGADFVPAPEGVLAPESGYNIKDSFLFKHDVNVGIDTISGFITFKNITNQAFDSLKVKIGLFNSEGDEIAFSSTRTNRLDGSDSLEIFFRVDVSAIPAGTYNLYLDVNPDNDQPELYHFNNFLYKYIHIIRESVLPVRLIGFSANKIQEQVNLNWLAENETEVLNYELLHTTNNNNGFVKLASVSAKVPGGTLSRYSYLHADPSAGTNYYLLKVNKKDGDYFYSSVQRIDFPLNNIYISPNPVKNRLTVSVPDSLNYLLRLTTMEGKVICLKNFHGSRYLDVSGIAKGLYVVQIITGDYSRSFTILKE